MVPPCDTGESGIRTALRKSYLRHVGVRNDSLVLDELGLAHARGRIDVAVIGRRIHGYEIKSANDTLRRLPRQLEVYRQSLQALTLVVDATHFPTVVSSTPDWCGILLVAFGPRGGARFHRVRQTRLNPELDPFMLATYFGVEKPKPPSPNGVRRRANFVHPARIFIACSSS